MKVINIKQFFSMNHKNLKDRTLFKRNYYAVSLKEGYVEKILNDKIKQIKETGEY